MTDRDIPPAVRNEMNVLALLEEALTAAEARAERAERERDEARALVANFVDQAVYSDSYGVQGSDFVCCHYCQGGGAPNIPMEHEATCPVRKAQTQADIWWQEFQDETKRAETAEASLAAERERTREMATVLMPLVEVANSYTVQMAPEDYVFTLRPRGSNRMTGLRRRCLIEAARVLAAYHADAGKTDVKN